MYKRLFRPLLFLFDPELIHHFTFRVLRLVASVPGAKPLLRMTFGVNDSANAKQLLGLTFNNPVGLAAGFDKDARLTDLWDCLGFGFVEIGTVTPVAQAGNEKPRLFRLPADRALVNRMGFNNTGVNAVVERLRKTFRRSKPRLIIGGNIGKNKVTPNERAVEDYVGCFEALFPCVDYFAVNVSSPNTPGLRQLQEREPLRELLMALQSLNSSKGKRKPLLLKISPDLSGHELDDVIAIVRETGTDGIIATNTTIARTGLRSGEAAVQKAGAGGLSGAPLTKRATDVLRHLRAGLGNDFPIISVGGIMTAEDAVERMRAGADLVQVYTGFVYEGPGFVRRISRALASR